MAELSSPDALEARLEQAEAPEDRLSALLELAWALRSTGTVRAHDLATEARGLAIELEDKRAQARAARTMAMTVRSTEALDDIWTYAEEARDLFDQTDDRAGQAAARDFLASLCEYAGDLSGGLSLALDALEIAREIGDEVRQGYALSSVGGILATSGEVDEAVERLEEGLALFEARGDEHGQTTMLARLSKVLLDGGRLDEAESYADRTLQIARAQDDEWLEVNALEVLGGIGAGRGRMDEAEALYTRAFERLQTPAARDVLGAELLVKRGRLQLELGELPRARDTVEEARRRAQKVGIGKVTLAEAHELLAEVAERQADFPAAYRELREASRLRAAVAAQEARNKRALADARAATEAAKKDAEIHRLRYVELHAMQAQLVEAERMALLGRVAAGTAHELNTPLGVLRSQDAVLERAAVRLAELARAAGDDREVTRLRRAVEQSRSSGRAALARIEQIVASFRRFTQLDEANEQDFDLREGLESALDMLRPSVPPNVRIERRLDAVPSLRGFPREVNQACLTILENAVEATEGEGTVSVETSSDERRVIVRIRDDGRGMSPEEREELFEVSLGRRGARAKMRLGLAAAWATVERHGGRIEVESAPGEGASFTLLFPRARDVDGAAAGARGAAPTRG